MTFCVSIKIREGLVGIADTRITSGLEHTTARKVTLHDVGGRPLFLMTSGLRSVRDKAMTYFEEVLEESTIGYDKLYQVVNLFATQVRRVAAEDKAALRESGLDFNLFTIVGGQLEKDKDHKLYLLYPEGNWVEVSESTPYFLIGESSYGKPILDRVLRHSSSMESALKLAYLSFDSTRISAVDVDFPIDVVLYLHRTRELVHHRYNRKDLQHLPQWWQERLRASVEALPDEWVHEALSKLSRPG
ncbi:MAG: peptidase [Nitrospirae bacterium]|jgi:putative proteasome-type protease|nr:peptidase [Nitrospirota bacterium]